MKKVDNFRKALKNLQELYRYEPPYDAVITAGLCALFSICFEQSWRAMKEVLAHEGWSEAQSGSPRQIVKTAFESGLITDEKGWLSMLEGRNLAAHTYNEEAANLLIQQTKDVYLPLFLELEKKLDSGE